MVTRPEGILMQRAPRPRFGRSSRFDLMAATALGLTFAGCASPGPTAGPETATDAEWRALARARPTPLTGAARVSIMPVQASGAVEWSIASALGPARALEELIVAGLLRRPDVHFVERRRFTAAVEAETAGARRPPGAPPAGVSPGAEYFASVSWIGITGNLSSVELSLTDRAGAVVASRRVPLDGSPEPLSVARRSVGAILDALADLGRRPAWEDPIAYSTGMTSGAEVDATSVARFLEGVVAESAWRWEPARRAYRAAASPAFFEAEAALARTARLRTGGTLGES